MIARLAVLLLIGTLFSVARAADPGVALPGKTEWKLASGAVFNGTATGFGRSVLCLQRKAGKLYVNGAKVENPASLALVKVLAAKHEVPVDNPRALQSYLAHMPNARVVLPFDTLQYFADGREQAVPIILLDAGDVALLRPSFNAWLALQLDVEQALQEAHQAREQQAQELRNQQAMLQMQAQALQVQRSMEQASWAQAAAMYDAAYAAEVAAAAQQQAANAQERGADAQQRQADAVEREERRRIYGF